MGESRDEVGDRRGVPFLNGDVWRVHISYRNIFGVRVGWIVGEYVCREDAEVTGREYVVHGAGSPVVMSAYAQYDSPTRTYIEDEDEVF